MTEQEIILEGIGLKKELVIQLISLSTAILALSISFLDKLTRDISNNKTLLFLRISWCGYFFTIIFGIWTLMAITGTLINGCVKSGSNIDTPEGLEIITFLISTVFMIWFGTRALKTILKNNLVKEDEKTAKKNAKEAKKEAKKIKKT